MKVPVTVLVVDDHPMVAEGIEAILETWDDIEVVDTSGSASEAIDAVQRLAPDVVLMDLIMPGMSGLSATAIILEHRPETRILILSMHDSAEYIATALGHGARGYILKDGPTDEIKTAIDTVMAGREYLCTGAHASLSPRAADGRAPLTSREQAICSSSPGGAQTGTSPRRCRSRCAPSRPIARTSSASSASPPVPG